MKNIFAILLLVSAMGANATKVCNVLVSANPFWAGANCTDTVDEGLSIPLINKNKDENWSDKGNEITKAYLDNGYKLNAVSPFEHDFVYFFSKP